MELGPNQKQWVSDLRSGEFDQCTGELHREGAYCALGMIDMEWAVIGPDDYIYAEKKVALTSSEYVLRLNDIAGLTFPEIADLIEKHADELFSEPR